MMLLLKIWLGVFVYNWVLTPIVKAFITVVLRHSKTVRGWYDRFIIWAIENGG